MKKGKKKWKDLNLCSDVFIHQCEVSRKDGKVRICAGWKDPNLCSDVFLHQLISDI